jgi:hypothetical protein
MEIECSFETPVPVVLTALPHTQRHSLTLSVWSRVLPEKLTGPQPVKKFPAFYGTEGSLPHSQKPAISPYPQLHQVHPPPPQSLFSNTHFKIIFPSTPLSFWHVDLAERAAWSALYVRRQLQGICFVSSTVLVTRS